MMLASLIELQRAKGRPHTKEPTRPEHDPFFHCDSGVRSQPHPVSHDGHVSALWAKERSMRIQCSHMQGVVVEPVSR